MTSVADVQRAVESLWPAATAEEWDAVGLVAGIRPIRSSASCSPWTR